MDKVYYHIPFHWIVLLDPGVTPPTGFLYLDDIEHIEIGDDYGRNFSTHTKYQHVRNRMDIVAGYTNMAYWNIYNIDTFPKAVNEDLNNLIDWVLSLNEEDWMFNTWLDLEEALAAAITARDNPLAMPIDLEIVLEALQDAVDALMIRNDQPCPLPIGNGDWTGTGVKEPSAAFPIFSDTDDETVIEIASAVPITEPEYGITVWREVDQSDDYEADPSRYDNRNYHYYSGIVREGEEIVAVELHVDSVAADCALILEMIGGYHKDDGTYEERIGRIIVDRRFGPGMRVTSQILCTGSITCASDLVQYSETVFTPVKVGIYFDKWIQQFGFATELSDPGYMDEMTDSASNTYYMSQEFGPIDVLGIRVRYLGDGVDPGPMSATLIKNANLMDLKYPKYTKDVCGNRVSGETVDKSHLIYLINEASKITGLGYQAASYNNLIQKLGDGVIVRDDYWVTQEDVRIAEFNIMDALVALVPEMPDSELEPIVIVPPDFTDINILINSITDAQCVECDFGRVSCVVALAEEAKLVPEVSQHTIDILYDRIDEKYTEYLQCVQDNCS